MLRVGIVILGGILVHLCLGSFYIFGNISLYMISYLRNRTDDQTLSNVDNLWISNTGIIMTPIGMTLGGVLNRCLGVRLATTIGCVLFCSGTGLTALTVQKSLLFVCLSYGALLNLGSAIAYGPPIQTVVKWLPNKPAFATGMIVCGFGGGATIFNQIVTAYLNPENLSPDLETDDGEKFFTNTALLDRVPKLFLLLAGIYVGCQILGIIALSEPGSSNAIQTRTARRMENTEKLPEKLPVKTVLLKLVTSKNAIILLLFVFLIHGGNQFAITLYKAYGQTFISDDRFLALIGSISSIFNCLGRPLWGAVMDRFGFQIAVKFVAATFVCLSCTIQFTESLGKVAFMIWICGLYGSFCGIWAVGPSTLGKLFGMENMVITMGAMFVAVSVATLVGGFIGLNLQSVIGWEGLFLLSGFMGATAFFLSFIFDGRDTCGNLI